MKKRAIYSLLIVFFVLILDQLTKYMVRTQMGPYDVIEVLPFFNIVNVRNRGAAFGMFSSFGNAFFIVISLAAIAFIFWIILSGKEDYRVFSLLAGGAAGNLIDRIALGSVVDFADVFIKSYHWPAFNVADSALTIGIAIITVRLVLQKH